MILSIFSGGLLIIPVVFALGASVFFIIWGHTRKQYAKIFAIVLLVLSVLSVISMISEK